jgi:hypothetical protein
MTKITGKIKKIFPTETFGGFEKRIFWLDDQAEKYANVHSLELWKNDCEMIDNYEVGDVVTCYIDIKGRYWEKGDKEGVINSLKCWNFEKDGQTFKKI